MNRNLGVAMLSPMGINLLSGDHRRQRILALLRQRGPMSRAELARATGIAKSSISILVEQLDRTDSVQIQKATPANRSKRVRGRPGELVEINPSSGAAIGIEFADEHVRGVIGDVSHEILAEREIHLGSGYSANQALGSAQNIVTELLEVTRVTPSRILGIGLAIAGSVYRPEGEKNSKFLSPMWEILNPAQELSLRTGFHVVAENSANLAAFAELLWGAGSGIEDFVFLKIGNSIDGGISFNNQIITGQHGGVGEFGHLNLDPNGPVCRCGHRGCLDTYSSVQAILSSASVAHGYEVNFLALGEAIDKGDAACTRIVKDAAERIGEAAALVCKILNPETVILSGEVLTLLPNMMSLIVDSFQSHALNINANVRLINGNLGNLAAALGGAALILGQNRH